MILLDTNVISELMRPKPEPRVLAWANGLDPEAVAITAMNEAEILHGLARVRRALPATLKTSARVGTCQDIYIYIYL